MKKYLFIILFALFFGLSSCGTIFKYQDIGVKRSAKIDYDILFLDSLGLFIFLVPGLVALGFDYATGTLFISEKEARARAEEFTPEIARELIFK
jgi:hypothetical protein